MPSLRIRGGVSDSWHVLRARISESRRRAARLRSMAPRMASNSTSSLNGFVRNSTAPAFIACTLIGTSPWPVMKMIGISVRSASCCCNSRPLSPGSVTSSTRQHGTVARRRDRNSDAEANVSGCQPAVLIEQLQRFAHGDVVINDEDNRRDVRHGNDLDSTACGRRARQYTAGERRSL